MASRRTALIEQMWWASRRRTAVALVMIVVALGACGRPAADMSMRGGDGAGGCGPPASVEPAIPAVQDEPGVVPGTTVLGTTPAPVPAASGTVPGSSVLRPVRPGCGPSSVPGTAAPEPSGPGSTVDAAPATSAPPPALAAGSAAAMTLGGPGAHVGNDPTQCPGSRAADPCRGQPGMWAAINGPRTAADTGDPYAAMCSGGQTDRSSCGSPNPLYRPSGYAYAIDVGPADVDHDLTLSAYDIGVYDEVDCAPTAPDCTTPQNFDIEVFDRSASEGTASFDRPMPRCHLTEGADDLVSRPATFRDRWVTVCSFRPSGIGVYGVRVRNSGLAGLADIGRGTNRYSLKVDGGSGTRLYPLQDVSLFTDLTGGLAFDLGAIPSRNAGHRLVIDAYDPGDGPYSIQVVMPSGTPASSCRYNATPSPTPGPAVPDTAADCRVTTRVATGGAGVYNGAWLRIEVDISPGYECGDQCWWKLRYEIREPRQQKERVTWSASIE